MILELVGSRILAPYVGTSIYVWTNLIGVVLASLSIGYWLGGKIAFQESSRKTLSNIILITTIFISITALFNNLLIKEILYHVKNYISTAFISSLILFAPSNILLAMFSPYIIQLRLKDLNKTGETVGNLYALSTIGSIFGTFFSGFFLISYLGSTKILFIIPIALLCISMLLYRTKGNFFKTFILILVIFILFKLYDIKLKSKIIDLDTKYNRVRIIDYKKVRTMILGNLSSSGQSLVNDDPSFNIYNYFVLSNYFNPNIHNILVIGGAGYTWPIHLLKNDQTFKLDVVEIDPELTVLAKKYFNLKNDPRLSIYHEDGRTFINRNNNKYDAIFIDVFNSYAPPFQLTTKETIDKIYSMLNDKGLVIMNMTSAVEGPKGELLRSEFYTYKNSFPQVYVFPTGLDGQKIQNIILIGYKSNMKITLKSNDERFKKYLNHLWTKKIPQDLPLLTDDFAPVEHYLGFYQQYFNK